MDSSRIQNSRNSARSPDSKNNDANIITHCLFNNEQDILTWLNDNDIILLDRGFRDATPAMRTLGYRIFMPSFLHGKTQLTPEQANQSRLVTANRWVIESGEHLIDIASLRYEY
jgi:hypothetical protein